MLGRSQGPCHSSRLTKLSRAPDTAATAVGPITPRAGGMSDGPAVAQSACPLRAIGPLLEQADERRLFRAVVHRLLQLARKEAVDDQRMDIALAADGGRITQHERGRLHRSPQLALGAGLRRWRQHFAQRSRAEQRTGPGAEILARKLLTGDGLEIGVDVGRFDRMRRTIVADVVK